VAENLLDGEEFDAVDGLLGRNKEFLMHWGWLGGGGMTGQGRRMMISGAERDSHAYIRVQKSPLKGGRMEERGEI
jgi:hypothetical protein